MQNHETKLEPNARVQPAARCSVQECTCTTDICTGECIVANTTPEYQIEFLARIRKHIGTPPSDMRQLRRRDKDLQSVIMTYVVVQPNETNRGH